jgi:hypothetical protein
METINEQMEQLPVLWAKPANKTQQPTGSKEKL